MNEYEKIIKKINEFCDIRDWNQFHNPKDLTIGIVTEAAELLDIFRFKNEEDVKKLFSSPEKFEEIKDEIADILFFIFRFSTLNNIDIFEALENKIEKNNKKYPSDKVKGKNLKYTEYKNIK